MSQNRPLAAFLVLLLAAGCSPLRKADRAYDQGQYLDALAQYQAVLKKNPKNVKAKIGYMRTAPLAAEVHLKNARAAQKAGRDELERTEVGAAVVLDPSNQVAVDWLARIEAAAEHQRQLDLTRDSVEAERQEADSKPLLPINPRSLEGMDLNFSRKTSLREIFQQLSKNSGINIILHASAAAQDPVVSVDLRGLSFQRILDTLMLQSDLFYKVLDPNTIMVFRKTPQNLLEYENKLIKTFYLSNAEVESVRQTFNSLMPQVRVFTDKRLNALTIMARQNDVNIATRIVNQLDKAKAEVMIYLELLEVAQTASERVGLMPAILGPTGAVPVYQVGATLSGGGGINPQKGTLEFKSSSVQYLLPSLALDLLKTSGDSKLLASPNVRVISGESGEVNIGNKISTTQMSLSNGLPATGSTPALGGSALAQTQYSYEDVGVKIKVKPRVHFNRDITLELESEIRTQISTDVNGRPNLSQRVIKTQARLRDGETAVFAGLLKEQERKQLQGIWGISEVPVLGSLLGHHNNEDDKQDVILTVRAVVVRQPDLKEGDFEAFDPDAFAREKPPFAAAPKP
jgi:type II secretory pathway component GspD/PulD (secretin)